VWSEIADNARRVKTYGINTYVTTYGDGALVEAAGMHNLGPVADEADMWGGPGDAPWTGKYPGQGAICVPESAKCGFGIMRQLQGGVPPGQMRYTNYGKGVAFWEADRDAARFVNDYQDVVSVDLYWATDPDLCAPSQGGLILGTGGQLTTEECHKPANYGRTVDRVRQLVTPSGSKPVYNFVELSQPGEGSLRIPVPEIKAAVWSSLIHEARGIVYFNHSFGGECPTQHVLDVCDPAIAKAVTAINKEIAGLAPVLNAPRVNGVSTTGNIDQLTKGDGKNFYVFTGSNRGSGSTAGSIKIPVDKQGVADVLGEDRTVPVVKGRIADTWADPNAVHLYRVGLAPLKANR